MRNSSNKLTCFCASFFPFCPLSWPPLFLPFSRHVFALFYPRKVLCSVEQRAQRRAWRGAVPGWTSPQISGRKFLPEICVKKGQQIILKAGSLQCGFWPRSSQISREKLYTPPPLPPFLAKRHFSGEGGGGVYFEGPRGRNFICPPFLYAPRPQEGIFRGGGVGVYKIWPRKILMWIVPWILGWVSSSCLFPRRNSPKKSTKKSPEKFTQGFVQKNSPRISAEAFS